MNPLESEPKGEHVHMEKSIMPEPMEEFIADQSVPSKSMQSEQSAKSSSQQSSRPGKLAGDQEKHPVTPETGPRD
jgi:hypothetical protein